MKITTTYPPHGDTFGQADAEALIGTTVDITVWDDDNRAVKATYPAAAVIGIVLGSWLAIATTGVTLTDADIGEVLGARPGVPETRIPFGDVIEIG